MIKTPEQIVGCREAGRVNSLILDAVERQICAGMSTAEIDDIVAGETRALGGRAACLGFEGFPRSVCTSLNDVVCHGIPSEREILREGDIINVDCTTEYGGYFGDASRMFRIGRVSEAAGRLVSLTQTAVETAVAAIKPFSTTLGDIGYIINGLARKNGYTVVREIGGHGVGLAMHEEPFVSHMCTRQGEGMLLLPGMVFTIEPMINEGSRFFTCDKQDGWTVRTKDGKRSAQVEHMLLITENGYEILSR
jgi:methionyl aminopeptidase